jgi:hypothetical protein
LGPPTCHHAIVRRAAAINLFHLPITRHARSTGNERKPWNMLALGLARNGGLPKEVGRVLVLAPNEDHFRSACR